MSSESGEGGLSNGATPIFIASTLWKIDNNVAENGNFQKKKWRDSFSAFGQEYQDKDSFSEYGPREKDSKHAILLLGSHILTMEIFPFLHI